MAFFQKFIDKTMGYFDTEDISEEVFEEEVEDFAPQAPQVKSMTSKPIREERSNPMNSQRPAVPVMPRDPEIRMRSSQSVSGTTTIDIKFPKKYEEAREIVNLLLQEISVLIDFQHMTDSQARRCIDYLDGARYVVDGNLKKISSTMWLLTPANVQVNIEDVTLRAENQDNSYDFDMKRR